MVLSGGGVHLTEQVAEQEALLRVQGLKKVFRSGESDLVLFENLSFEVKRGEMLGIVGESGAGKSTLLHILSALDQASAGDVYCAQLKLNSLSADEAAKFRNREAGFVWQFHYLLPEFTAAENVAMPLLQRGKKWAQVAPEASRWLREVGLEQRAHHRSGELSGGEQQRVALARARTHLPDCNAQFVVCAALPPGATTGARTSGRDQAGIFAGIAGT